MIASATLKWGIQGLYSKLHSTTVLFDCDGVLVESESLVVPLLVRMANESGADLDLDDGAELFLGAALATCIDRISERLGEPVRDDFAVDFRQRVDELFRTQLRPVDGVDDLLTELGAPCAVVSNSPTEVVHTMLWRTGLLRHFQDKIFSACDIGYFKPQPHVYTYAAERLGISPDTCIVIEDSVAGVRSAATAHMTVVGFAPHGGAEALTAAGAVRTFTSMRAVGAFLANRTTVDDIQGGSC